LNRFRSDPENILLTGPVFVVFQNVTGLFPSGL